MTPFNLLPYDHTIHAYANIVKAPINSALVVAVWIMGRIAGSKHGCSVWGRIVGVCKPLLDGLVGATNETRHFPYSQCLAGLLRNAPCHEERVLTWLVLSSTHSEGANLNEMYIRRAA